MWQTQSTKGFPGPLVVKSKKTVINENLELNSSKKSVGGSYSSLKCSRKLEIKRELHKKNKINHRSFSIKHIKKFTMNETKKSKITYIARYAKFFDHVFPIEATFWQQPADAGTNYIHPIMGSLSIIKRITSITYDYDQEEHKYKLEDRFFDNVANPRANQKFYMVGDLLRLLITSNNYDSN